MVELTMRAVVPAHVLIRRLDGESVLLNLDSERYFGLDATGTRMWELVTSHPSIGSAQRSSNAPRLTTTRGNVR